ncbi:serine/threonine-protein kinase [Thermomonospora umbrina]|uniref:non-specific serine/threonine protein kinase n=1 Tax=Thermomonospora umbrina TaxID=111806 RepID=A0A3D9SNQ5_9ACTN|nr:serine/threonine-protein kinase [Thermomonospora umbrina]REE97518.1 serine/threonine-protein kinase [Thermomonospora umbrina]
MSGEWAVAGYRHVRELGDGAAGRVVLALRRSSGTPVAIRYLRARPFAEAAARDEARRVAAIEDAGPVRLQEYVESPQGVALISELVNGISLERMLKAEGRLTPEAALAVFQSTLLALGAAHRAGIAHGAVSPGKVLVQGDGVSRLADLGVAAWAGDSPTAEVPLHRAPEAWSGPATPAGDLYSATATLVECLTGDPPLSAASLHGVPEALIPLVSAGLAEDPDTRPASASVFLGRLETTALAAFGPGWDERGRADLVERAAVLRLLFPLSHKLVGDDGTRGGRRRGAGRGLVAAVTAALVLAAGAGAVVYASGGPDGQGRRPPIAADTDALPGGPPERVGLGPTGTPSVTASSPTPSTTVGPGAVTSPRPRRSPSGEPERPEDSPSPRPSASPSSSPSPFVTTDVRIVALSMEEGGTTATAEVRVTGSGKGRALVTVQFFEGDTAHGAPVTATVEVDGEATVHLSHTYESCPTSYAAQATAAPGSPQGHQQSGEGSCSAA